MYSNDSGNELWNRNFKFNYRFRLINGKKTSQDNANLDNSQLNHFFNFNLSVYGKTPKYSQDSH